MTTTTTTGEMRQRQVWESGMPYACMQLVGSLAARCTHIRYSRKVCVWMDGRE